ncbi:MAG: DMT family transporter [Peptostreptococcaceae bacterium]|nr:DMT family transporter [Peptostreptococcaceae bacterium]
MDTSTKNYLKIALAGVFWGTLGLFGKTLESYGLSPEMISFARLSSGFMILVLFFMFKKPSVLKIDARGLFECAIIGVISQGFFNLAYFSSIRLVGAFTAVVLLYFSIVIMFVFGTVFYKEKPSRKKVVAVIICLIGSILGATGGDLSSLQANTLGIIMGILASLAYSLMPAISKKTAAKYDPFTIIVYSFLFGALFLVPFAKPWIRLAEPKEISVYLVILLFGLIASTIPYGLYIPSLHNIQISRLGVITSVELVVSILIAAFILKEEAGFGKFFGAVLIMLSILVMNTNIDYKAFLAKRGRSQKRG